MHALEIAALIFCLRIADVSIGTLRTIYTIRGNRGVAASLGVVESGIWLIAVTKAVKLVRQHPVYMLAWALGFGAGTFIGITIEKWIATGMILMRIISPEHSDQMREVLRRENVGVTTLPGEGIRGSVSILFVVAPRRRWEEIVRLVQQVDPDAFITTDPVTQAIGGYVPLHPPAAGIRK